MPVFVLLLLIPLVAFTLYTLVTYVISSHRHAAEAKRLGCKPIPIYPTRDFLGITNILDMVRANDAGRLPQHLVERVNTVCNQEGRPVSTTQLHVLRNWLIFTHDPKNIQAILATQFDEFELGPIRFGTFSPL